MQAETCWRPVVWRYCAVVGPELTAKLHGWRTVYDDKALPLCDRDGRKRVTQNNL